MALDAVAGGVHAVHVGAALVVVDAQSAGLPEREPRLLGEAHVGPGAGPDRHVVDRQLALGRAHAAGLPRAVEHDLLDLRREEKAHAVRLGAVLHVVGHVAVERSHDLIGLIDHRDRHPAVDEVLGHLQPDVAGADHDRLAAAALRPARKRSAASTVRAVSTASAPGMGGGTATAPVAMTISSKPSSVSRCSDRSKTVRTRGRDRSRGPRCGRACRCPPDGAPPGSATRGGRRRRRGPRRSRGCRTRSTTCRGRARRRRRPDRSHGASRRRPHSSPRRPRR